MGLVQLAAAKMLGRWSTIWRQQERERAGFDRLRGRMGAIVHAWRVVARRGAYRGLWGKGERRGELLEPSTRLAMERTPRGADWLSPKLQHEQPWGSEAGSPTGVTGGSYGAWLLWYVRWTAPERVRARRGWAAWEARRRGGGRIEERYARLVDRGGQAIGHGMGLTKAALARRQAAWRDRCRVVTAVATGVVVGGTDVEGDGWTTHIERTTEGAWELIVPRARKADGRRLARDMRAALQEAVTLSTLEEREARLETVEVETLRRRRDERTTRLTRAGWTRSSDSIRELLARERGDGTTDGAAATELDEETPGQEWAEYMEEEEEIEREMEEEALGDG